MRSSRFAAAVLATLALGGPAAAAIGVPVSLGVANATNATSLSLTGVTAAAGTLVVVAAANASSAGTYSISDSGGNAWSTLGQVNNGSNWGTLYWSILTTAITSGSITVSGYPAFRNDALIGAAVTGVVGVDTTAGRTITGAGNAGMTFSITTPGALAIPVEIIFGMENEGGALSTPVSGAGWTNIASGLNDFLRLDYKVVATSNQVNYTVMNGNTGYDSFIAAIQGFKGPYVAPTLLTRKLLGAGL